MVSVESSKSMGMVEAWTESEMGMRIVIGKLGDDAWERLIGADVMSLGLVAGGLVVNQ